MGIDITTDAFVELLHNPRVRLNLGKGHPLVRVVLRETLNEIARQVGHELGESEVNLSDALARVLLSRCFEWRRSDQQFVQKHSAAPNIDVLVVLMAFDHLRREAIQCSTWGCAPGRGRMYRSSEIGNFKLSTRANQTIFWFDVAVDHVFRVAVRNGITQFHNVLCRSALVKTVALAEQSEQFTVGGIFKNDVDSHLVIEIAIKAKDVGVVYM
jgi:hypothetical protein